MRKCSKCGYEAEDIWFCPECGNPMEEIEESKGNVSSEKSNMILKNYDNDTYKSEDNTDNKYDSVKKSTLYHVMSIILIIWAIIIVITYIFKLHNYGIPQYTGDFIIDLVSYSFQFAGSLIPGIMGIRWIEKDDAYAYVKKTLVLFIVLSAIGCILSIGASLLIYGIPIALYIIGAVRQMNFLKEAGCKPENNK